MKVEAYALQIAPLSSKLFHCLIGDFRCCIEYIYICNSHIYIQYIISNICKSMNLMQIGKEEYVRALTL